MLDLEPIESRRQVALVTAETTAVLGLLANGPARSQLLLEAAKACARSSADVPALLDEIRTLRKELNDAQRVR